MTNYNKLKGIIVERVGSIHNLATVTGWNLRTTQRLVSGETTMTGLKMNVLAEALTLSRTEMSDIFFPRAAGPRSKGYKLETIRPVLAAAAISGADISRELTRLGVTQLADLDPMFYPTLLSRIEKQLAQ